MLHSQVKTDIKQCYENLGKQLRPLHPSSRFTKLFGIRNCENIGRGIPQEKQNAVAEAGTGIGKSLSYLLGGIPFALFNNKNY